MPEIHDPIVILCTVGTMALFNQQALVLLLIAGCLAFSITAASYADDPGAAPTIVITPTRSVQPENTSSSTVYVLDHQQIASSGARTTAELLRGIPGIQIDDLFGNGVEVTISVRGFSSTANANTLILVNGRRLNHSDTAAPDLHHIFPKDIQRIEVMVGSAGSLYGDQAVGGVINIITRNTTDDTTQASLMVGSYDYKSVQFLTTQRIGADLGYRLSAEKFESDHYRDHNRERNGNVHGLLEYAAGKHALFVELQHIEDELELPGALLQDEFDADPTQINAGFGDDFINEDTTVLSLGYNRDIQNAEFSIDVTQRQSDADVRQSFRNSPSPATGFITREYTSLNPKLSGRWMNGGNQLSYVAGLDLEQNDYQLFLPNVLGITTAENNQQATGLYFQVHPALNEKTQLTLGMRHSSLDKDIKDGFSFPAGLTIKDDVQVAEIGLIYRPQPHLRWTFRVDENFRFAKIDELALAEPDQILDTQTGLSYELGVDWNSGLHRLTASIYRLDLENEIVFDPTVGPDFGFGPAGANVNLQKTRRDGLSLLWTNQIGSSLVLKTELGLVSATYQSGTFSGNEISGVADRVVKIRADYLISKKLSCYLEAHHKGEHFAQGDNANAFAQVDAVNIINAGFKLNDEKLAISFRVNNLADKQYAEFVTNNGFGAAYQPSPDRNYQLAANYHF